MPPRKKKHVKPGDVKLPRRPRGKLAPSGRIYEGAVVEKCLVPPARVAVWDGGKEPVCGVMVGIQSHRDGRVPDLRVAVNQNMHAIPLNTITDMCELRANQARPTPEDRDA